MKPPQQKLTFLKPELSMKEEYKKTMYQKNAILDKEFSCYQQGICQGIVKNQIDQELNFKKELDKIVQENQKKDQFLKNVKANQVVMQLQNQEASIFKKQDINKSFQTTIKKPLEIPQMKITNLLIEDVKRSAFHQTSIDNQNPNKEQTQLALKESLKNQLNIQDSAQAQQISTLGIHKDQQQYDQLNERFTEIDTKLQSVEQEAIFQNSTNDQYKFKAKKYETIIMSMKKKNQELRELIEIADSRNINLIEHITLSKQQMQIAQNNLHLQKDQFKVLQEAEEETLQLKQNIRDMEKQDLMSLKKNSCEVMMKIDFFSQQKQNQVQDIENLDYQKKNLLEQKQLTSFVEQNIDTLTKLSEIFVDQKFNVMDDICHSSLTLIGLSSPLTPSKVRASKLSPFQNANNFFKHQISIDDTVSPKSKSGNNSPRFLRLSSRQNSKSIKDQNLIRQNSLQINNLDQFQVGSKERDQKDNLDMETEKIEEIKNEQERILLSSLYFLLATLKKHKHLIDEVNDKGEVEPTSDNSFDKFEKIDELIDKYQKGFMKKKLFEQFNNRKKFLKKTSSFITSSRNHLSILIPKDPKNSTESIAQMRNSFLSKERFFFFQELHSYFPLTFKELKETLLFIFPKSFSEMVIELIIEVASNDILIRFFLSRDDIVDVGESCFNAFEYFKQFNMILTNHEQLEIYAQKAKNQNQTKGYGSRRLSQYSPLKNPIYLMQKEEFNSPSKSKNQKPLAFKLDLQNIQMTNNNISSINMDKTPIKQEIPGINIIDFDEKQSIQKKFDRESSPYNSNRSNDISQNSIEEENGAESNSSKSKSSQEENSERGDIQESTNSHNTKYQQLKINTAKESPDSSIWNKNEQFDQEEREEQAQLIKEQEQSILGEFIILQLQYKSIQNFINIIKEIIDSEKVIFSHVNRYKEKNGFNHNSSFKPENLKFNQQQILSFIKQAEKTLQFKKQREQKLNEKLMKNLDIGMVEDEDEEREIDEIEYDPIKSWQRVLNPSISADSPFFKQNFHQFELSSPISNFNRQEKRKLVQDSFIMEESQLIGTNQSLQIDQPLNKQSAGFQNFQGKDSEEILKQEVERAKELIILLDSQNKKPKVQNKSLNVSNSSLKFKKIEQKNQNGDNFQDQKDSSSGFSESQLKLKSILSKPKEINSHTQLQLFQEQKLSIINKEKEYIESQRQFIKKEASIYQQYDQNDQTKSSSLANLEINSQMNNNLKKQQIGLFDFTKLGTTAEQKFYNTINKEDINTSDLKNNEYFIENLKAFHNDAFFLQKIYILGKNRNIPFNKSNYEIDLPKGLHPTKYFEKLKTYERQQFNTMQQNTDKNKKKDSQRSVQKDEKKQTNEQKKSSHSVAKSQHINIVYNTKSGIHQNINELIRDGRLILDTPKNKIQSLIQEQKENIQNDKTQQGNQETKVLQEKQTDQETIGISSHQKIDKFKSKLDQKLEFIKNKNQQSLKQLKRIFNLDQKPNRQQNKQQSSNSTITTFLESKKNNASFQSQFTNGASALVSASPSISYNNSEVFKNYPNQIDSINYSKNSSYQKFIISQEEKSISHSQALQKISVKPSPYENQIYKTQNKDGKFNLRYFHRKSLSQPKIDYQIK